MREKFNILKDEGKLMQKARAYKNPHFWSKRVTQESNALDLEKGVFTRSPRQIALSLKRSAERSKRRKSSPYRSAMSMLTFYQNRAGKNLSKSRIKELQTAKEELRKLYGRIDKPKKVKRQTKVVRRRT